MAGQLFDRFFADLTPDRVRDVRRALIALNVCAMTASLVALSLFVWQLIRDASFDGSQTTALLFAFGTLIVVILAALGTLGGLLVLLSRRLLAEQNSASERARAYAAELERRVRERTNELRQVGERYEAAADRFRTMFESAPVSLWEYDLSAMRERIRRQFRDAPPETLPGPLAEWLRLARSVVANAATVRLLRAENTAQVISRLPEIFTDDMEAFLGGMVAAFVRGETQFGRATTIRALDGAEIPVRLDATIAAGHEDVWDRVIVSIVDLSERRQAEEAIRQSEQLYRLLADNVSDMVFILDLAGRVTYVSPSVRRMLGVEPDAVTGNPLGDVLSAASARRVEQVLQEELQRDAQADVSRDRVRMFEVSLRQSGGDLLASEVSVSFLRNAEGDPVGLIGSARDVSERKQAERRMAELHETRATFIRIVAHQLRTPLNAMRWNLESLLAEELGPLRKPQREFLTITLDADREIIRRIHDLLSAMDIDEGAIRLVREQASLEEIWNAMVPLVRERCAAKGLRCTITPSGRLPGMRLDQTRIREAIWNLLDNALTYTPEGGSIAVRWQVTPEAVRVDITDTGIGIPAAEQPRVFSRFFRGANASLMRPDASGLGLFNAKYYIEQHGGRIGFTSTEGTGSTFWFELPFGS